jgi:hypothetical protein
MNWGRPGHPTIAERVKNWIEPVFTDKDSGTYGTTGYVPGAHRTGSGTKFKAMDYRGLLDAPDAL